MRRSDEKGSSDWYRLLHCRICRRHLSLLLTCWCCSYAASMIAVLAQLPMYGLSLLIVGFYWLSHHRIFMVIRRHTMTLIWLNFAFLLCIEFQPIFNNLHASYPTSHTTTILYVSEQAATELLHRSVCRSGRTCLVWYPHSQPFVSNMNVDWRLSPHLSIKGDLPWISARRDRHSSRLHMVNTRNT